MAELVEGAVYMCSDGWRRKLLKVAPTRLTYANEIPGGSFMELSPTIRWQAEPWFVDGEIESTAGSVEMYQRPSAEPDG